MVSGVPRRAREAAKLARGEVREIERRYGTWMGVGVGAVLLSRERGRGRVETPRRLTLGDEGLDELNAEREPKDRVDPTSETTDAVSASTKILVAMGTEAGS